MRCIACGCSELDAEGFKCAQCGGAPGVRAEQCYVTESTKAQLLAHASELQKYGVLVEQPEILGKRVDYVGGIALALQVAESLQPGILRKLVCFLRDLAIPQDEILRLRLAEPEEISEIITELEPTQRRSSRRANHYVYRMDHDTGFAPHARGRLCTLCGCKITTVESWARPDSWVIGVGGKGTGRPDRLIYAMKVESATTVRSVRKHSRDVVRYLDGHHISEDAVILVSRYFYYFGNNAIPIPAKLREDLLITRQGCKKVGDEAIISLASFLRRKYPSPGVLGTPNNPVAESVMGYSCRCSPKRLRS
jgi:hypothetical protein